MKLISVFFISLIVIVVISNLAIFNGGIVSFSVDGYLIKIDIRFVCFLILLTFIIFHILLVLLGLLMNFFQFRTQRMKQKASYSFSLASIYRGLGNLKKAEKLFLKKAEYSEMPEAHFIAAAEVAHQKKDCSNRDKYLEKAFGYSTSKKLPIAIIKKFEWMIEEEKFDSAIKILGKLPQHLKKQRKMIVLQKTLYEKTGNYRKILDMLPDLKRTDEFKIDYLKQLELSCAINIINTEPVEDIPALKKAWHSFSREIRQKPPLIAAYVKFLLQNNLNKEAEMILKKYLDVSFDISLVEIYGSIASEKPKRMLRAIQYWTSKYGETPELEIAAALQCINATMWGKAKNHLGKVIENSPTPFALKLMADIEEQLGNHGVSLVRRRQGLELAAKEGIE